jgi:hypothetical protein
MLNALGCSLTAIWPSCVAGCMFVVRASSVPMWGCSWPLEPLTERIAGAERSCLLFPFAYLPSRFWGLCSDHFSAFSPSDARMKIWQHAGIFSGLRHNTDKAKNCQNPAKLYFSSFQTLFSHLIYSVATCQCAFTFTSTLGIYFSYSSLKQSHYFVKHNWNGIKLTL